MMKGSPSLGPLGVDRVGASGKLLTPSGSLETPTAIKNISDIGNTPDASYHLKWQKASNPSRSLYQSKKKKRVENQDLIDNILHTLGEELVSQEQQTNTKLHLAAAREYSTRLRAEAADIDSTEVKRKVVGERLELELRKELLGTFVQDRAPLTPTMPALSLMTGLRTPVEGADAKDADESGSASASGSFGQFTVKGKLVQKLTDSKREARRPLSSLPDCAEKRTKGASPRRPDSPL